MKKNSKAIILFARMMNQPEAARQLARDLIKPEISPLLRLLAWDALNEILGQDSPRRPVNSIHIMHARVLREASAFLPKVTQRTPKSRRKR